MPGLDYIPPHSLEAEVAVLKSMFYDSHAAEKATRLLSPEGEEFYKPSHQKIYMAMIKLLKIGTPIDLITLADELGKEEKLEEVGGREYLNRIFLEKGPSMEEDGYSTKNIEHHAKIVFEKYLLRLIIIAVKQIEHRAVFYEMKDLDDLTKRMQNLVSEIRKKMELFNANFKDVD